MRKIFLIVTLLSVQFFILGQKYPKPVLPGKSYTIKPVGDTLWVLNDNQLRKVILMGKNMKIVERQNTSYKNKLDSLTIESSKKDSLIIKLSNYKELYKKSVESNNNVAVSNDNTKGYPIAILPGNKIIVKPIKDTLWVMKDSQLRRAIAIGKKYKICEEQNSILNKKISLMNQRGTEKDSLVSVLKKDRDFYMTNWKTCNEDIKILGKKVKRQKLFTRLSLAGIVVAFVAGILIK